MNLNKVFQENCANLLFSESMDVKLEREKVLKKFENEYFDRKNNESLKNINYHELLNLNYNYKVASDLSLTKKKSNGSYSINLINGRCENYKDDKIEITNIISNNLDFFFNNKLASTNDLLIDLNSLFLNSGIKILIKKNEKIEIKIYNILSDNNLTVFQKNLIKCEEGSNVNIIEEYENNNLSLNNVYNLIEIDKNSKVNHYIIQDNSKNHNLYLSSYTTCKEKSFYNQKLYNFSQGFVGNYHYTDLTDEDAEVSHNGIFFLSDNNFTSNKTFVKHLAPNCKSNQIYKGILNDYSKAAYFSNTYVDEIAQKTEGYQLSKGILLSENASFFSKPELRIFADDVKCSHGSTIGPVEENAIFYLRSRGNTKSASIKMLISSYINKDLEQIENQNVTAVVEKNLIKFLSKIK